MPAIVEFPQVVEDAIKRFGHIFANEPERQHFGEYLTGLLLARKKTVNGMNAEFAQTTDQSCLNRWITSVDWSVETLNEERLQFHQEDPTTRYSKYGTIALDDVLIDHDGELIEDVGWLWDHAEKRNVIAHDYLITNYICESGKHYPLEFRRFIKEEDCKERKVFFKDHTQLFIELVDWVVAKGIPGDFAFDSYYTNAQPLNHINRLDRGYVGDLKFNRWIDFQGKRMHAIDIAKSIRPEIRKPIERNGKKQWYFTKSCRIPDLDHKVRILILWKAKNDENPAKILVTNRIEWEVRRIQGVYKNRWSGTETFHRDGKQYLGMGECQLRSGQSQTRHMYLVILAHSLLISVLKKNHPCEWAKITLNTIGEACRFVLKETLGKTISWVIEEITVKHRKKSDVMSSLGIMSV
jgi:DDE superfamily endonuclease